MKLRKQLLLLSLVSLSLPWAGLQFIQEMERTLKNGQVAALTATGKVIAAYLASEQNLQQDIQRFHRLAPSAPVYLHPLLGPPIVDGYNEEWQSQYPAQHLFSAPSATPIANNRHGEAESFSSSVVGGIYGDEIYLYLRVFDKNLRYYTPAMPSPTTSDHVLLHLNNNQQLYLFAAGPGEVQVARYENGKYAVVYPVRGAWIEAEAGYQLELSLPRHWADQQLGLSVFDSQSKLKLSNHPSSLAPPHPLFRSDNIEQALRIFRQSGLRLGVSTPSGELLALDGSIDTPVDQAAQQHGFIRWFYQVAIGEDNLPRLASPAELGRFNTPEIQAAQSADSSALAGWYQEQEESVVRLAQTIVDGRGETLGVIVLDQSADSLVNMTSSAFYRMLFYSLVTTSITAIGFVAYASWLSWRIRRLSRATAAAVSDTGKIADDFPILRSRDELGDLSRHYAQLLSRLREYTNYLRTLSSKLSHELRTPLAIVQSSLDNLEHENLTAQAGVYAERAKLGTTRLSNILNAMSAASRVEQAISGAEMETIPCDELLRNLKAAYEDVYSHAQFKLRIRDDEGKLECLASGELLVQMLDKLVDNAADFCPEGGTIELGLYRHQNQLVFTVFNQGPPLPKHMHGQLFDSMVSVREKSQKDSGEGHHLGLGLYIVRLIVDFHRGEVQGYNIADNSGVIFEVRLPV